MSLWKRIHPGQDAARGALLGAAALIILGSLLCASAAGAPPNDAFGDAEVLAGPSGEATGTNRDATLESREPQHAGAPCGRSVWWRWKAPITGGASFSTIGSDFDTLIAVYTGSSLASLVSVAANDDASAYWGVYQSRVSFEITEGTEYSIAVDGYDGEWGSIRLSWSTVAGEACEPPPEPSAESPTDGSEGIAAEVTLSWNQEVRRILRKVIYGADDRRDVYQVTDPDLLAAWDSTVALVSRSDLSSGPGGSYTLPSRTFGVDYDLCPAEPYFDQPDPAWCSGFLVAPDLVATAGHCVEVGQDCADVAFVFGFRMLDAATPVLTFEASQVYFCRGIVGGMVDDAGADWAVIRLDREVPDHEPLPIRRQGKIEDGAPLVIIGHPSGLPAKIAGGANVRDNGAATYFTANLDAYGGNSGSAVFNADTLQVEGILVRGEEDFELQMAGDCWESVRCPDDGCGGEDVTRITMLDQFIPGAFPDVTYDVLFGECGNLVPVARISETSYTISGLEPQKAYCWQIVARGACGTALGPVWTFTTADAGDAAFIRGDVAQDSSVNLSDAVSILNYLFLAGAVPPCLDSADTDDNGSVNLTDAVYLLGHLFLAGAAPPPPHGSCGQDPSPDDLDCQEHAACP
ncbi:MAG: trypsin-like peptidase domain-containing protein [Planctomycetes bacterium]|nr:trypsin-like peptidase domain-containing protein [Planctomycetota bacterium]